MDEVGVVAVIDGKAVVEVDKVRNVDNVEGVEEVEVVDVVAVVLVVLLAAEPQLELWVDKPVVVDVPVVIDCGIPPCHQHAPLTMK